MHNGDEYVFPWDVKWPASSTDGHLALFDGSTGKKIKDWWSVPTVPTNISSFNNDSWYLTSSTWVTSVNGNHWAVTGIQTTSNLKTSLSDNSDTYYPSQKAVKTAVDAKQDTLVSWNNIKTVNNESILWSWNISVGTLTAETVVSGDSGTTYTIKVSNSEPASWTPATTITFVI